MYNTQNKAEGIYTKLKTPLVKGQTYKINFTVAHCQYADFAVRQFPFLLTKEKVNPKDIKNNSSIELQVIKLDKHVIYTDKWVQLSGIYTAKGGEEYLTIMNTRFRFTEKKHISRILYKDASKTLNREMDRVAYYFFDNIEVLPVNESANYCQTVNYSNPKKKAKIITSKPQKKDSITKETSTFNLKPTIKKKLVDLQKKGIIHPDSPLEVDSLKKYTHHIFLFDISSSMSNNMLNSKNLFNKIAATIPSSDLITGISFNDNGRYMFQRSNKSSYTSARVNTLQTNGGTTLERGLDLVNKSIRSNEKTKFYLITDVTKDYINKLMKKYIYLNLRKTSESQLLHEFIYPRNNPKEEKSLTATELYNYDVIQNNLPRSNKTENVLENITPVYVFDQIVQSIFKPNNTHREVNGMFSDKSVNDEKSQIVFLSDCEFEEDTTNTYHSLTSIKSENYVFLVDVSSSMRKDKKMDELKKSLLTFNERLSPLDRMSLITFSNRAKLILDRITSYESDTLKRTMRSISAGGSTNVDRGLSYVYKYYIDHENGQKVKLVLYTDGLFEVSNKVRRMIKSSENIELEIYQFGNEPNKEIAKLAKENLIKYRMIEKEKIDESLTEVAKKKNEEATDIYSEKIAWRTWF